MEVSSAYPRFDLDHLPIRRSFEVTTAERSDLPYAVDLACNYFPHARAMERSVLDVHHRSRSILIVRSCEQIVGAAAFLCLNREGFAHLSAGDLSVAEPDASLLTAADEPAAAVYAWLLCVPGSAVAAMGQIMTWLRQPARRSCDLYACPGSGAGERFMVKTGFRSEGSMLNGRPLWVYRRSAAVAYAAEG